MGCDQNHACEYVSSSDIVRYKLVRHSQVNCILCMFPEGNIAHKINIEGSLSSYNVNRVISVGMVTVIYRNKTKARHSPSQRDTKHTVHIRHPILCFRISNLGCPPRLINMQSRSFFRTSLVQLSLVYSAAVWKFAPWVTYSHLIVVTCRKQ